MRIQIAICLLVATCWRPTFVVSSLTLTRGIIAGCNHQQRSSKYQVHLDAMNKKSANTESIMPTTRQAGPTPCRPCVIQNFRPASGLSPRIYRCASPDGLADIISEYPEENSLHAAEKILLYDAGLILDLRSPSERDDGRARQWSSRASFVLRDASPRKYTERIDDETVSGNITTPKKQLVRIDVLSPSRFYKYAEEHFLTPTQKALSKWYMIAQANKAHELRIEALNERGLSGLSEVILQTGGKELCLALQEITRQLERDDLLGVAIHCVQGKDRTGMVVMLCQTMAALSDEEIIADYQKSNELASASAAADDILSNRSEPRRRGKLDRSVFSGASKEAMVETLVMLRAKYGSVDGYLDSIGFGMMWRNRFRRGLGFSIQSRL